MDIFQNVVNAIASEMDLPLDGVSILQKAAEKPDQAAYLAEELGVEAGLVKEALSSKSVAEQTVAGFAAQLGVSEDAVSRSLWTNARFREDMEADSLDLVGLIMALESLAEDEFGLKLEIPDEEAQKIATVGDAIAYLTAYLSAQGVSA